MKQQKNTKTLKIFCGWSQSKLKMKERQNIYKRMKCFANVYSWLWDLHLVWFVFWLCYTFVIPACNLWDYVSRHVKKNICHIFYDVESRMKYGRGHVFDWLVKKRIRCGLDKNQQYKLFIDYFSLSWKAITC